MDRQALELCLNQCEAALKSADIDVSDFEQALLAVRAWLRGEIDIRRVCEIEADLRPRICIVSRPGQTRPDTPAELPAWYAVHMAILLDGAERGYSGDVVAKHELRRLSETIPALCRNIRSVRDTLWGWSPFPRRG